MADRVSSLQQEFMIADPIAELALYYIPELVTSVGCEPATAITGLARDQVAR